MSQDQDQNLLDVPGSEPIMESPPIDNPILDNDGSEEEDELGLFTANGFEIRLESFDGPIDLLLHLVKQNELKIEKIALARVTSQYLECIEQMKDLDLEVAGEYLVIAATLVSIKSSIILNEPVQLVQDEEGNLVDPHEELLKKLREAEIYRDGARHLSSRPVLGMDVFNSAATVFPGEEPEMILKNHDVMLLGKALLKILQKGDAPAALMTISVDSVSIVERMVEVIDTLKLASSAVSFKNLVTGGKQISEVTRGHIISTFLALLELCKRQVIHVTQQDSSEDISVSLAGSKDNSKNQGVDIAKLESEFDAKVV